MKPEEMTSELGQRNAEFKQRMDKLRQEVNMLTKPDGSKAHPARTCRDLKANYPDMPSGQYWLDPNAGCISDAIKVSCDFSSMDIVTCIDPKHRMSIPTDYWSHKLTHARKWMGEDHKFTNIEYESDMSQLTYLSYLSREAFQQVTVHCDNQIVWNDNKNSNFKDAFHFMGTKRTVFTPHSNVSKRSQVEVIEDGCSKPKAGTMDKTKLKFRTSKFVRLPIVDVMPTKQHKKSRFGVEMGPVCFV